MKTKSTFVLSMIELIFNLNIKKKPFIGALMSCITNLVIKNMKWKYTHTRACAHIIGYVLERCIKIWWLQKRIIFEFWFYKSPKNQFNAKFCTRKRFPLTLINGLKYLSFLSMPHDDAKPSYYTCKRTKWIIN